MPSYVIEFNRRNQDRVVHEFDSLRDAVKYRLELERSRTDADIEIAALTSQSREALERTHSRYFTGREFCAS